MLYLFGAIGLAFIALCGALSFEHSRVVAWKDRAAAAEARYDAAETRAQAFALMWEAQKKGAEAAKLKADDERKAIFDALDARVRKIGGRCVAPLDADRLLADIARAANAAGTATVDQSSGDAVSRSTQAKRKP